MAVAGTDADTGQLAARQHVVDPAHNAAFLANQLQSAGHFQLDDTEAWSSPSTRIGTVLRNVPVTNVDDHRHHWDEQTSLNNVQAVHTPGEPQHAGGVAGRTVHRCRMCGELVSTGGLNQGTLSIRFQDIDLEHFVAPTVSARVVKLSGSTVNCRPGPRTSRPRGVRRCSPRARPATTSATPPPQI